MVSQARMAATLGCLVLVGCGAPQTTPEERLFASHNLLRHAGYGGLGPISSGVVTPDQDHSMRAHFLRDACYVLAVFGQQGLQEMQVTVMSPDESALIEERSVGHTSVLSFCAERTGEHLVTVASEESSGAFQMAYWVGGEDASGEAGSGATLSFGRPVVGMLPPGERYVEYSFSVQQRRLITIDLESRDFDSFLYLLREGIELDRDDDSGGNLNSRITRPLEPGTYTVRASSFMERGSGRFTLTVR